MPNLETTNLLLGIMAAVSVLEALVLIGVAVMGYRMYSNAMRTIRELEQRQVAPLVARANDILADVKGITTRVSEQTERVDQAVRTTIERVDDTADRVRVNLRTRVNQTLAYVRAVRSAVEGALRDDPGGSGVRA